MSKINTLFKSDLKAINFGTESFNNELLSQNVDSVQVEWRPPAGGNKALLAALTKLDSDEIAQANQKAIDLFMEAAPFLVDYQQAKDVIPGMTPYTILHAGPPIAWERMCGPMQGAVIGALILEGLAENQQQAEALAASGEIKFAPCHEHNAVGPMAGVISYSMVVQVFKNKTHGNYAYCPVPEGMGGKVMRYGAFGPEVIERLKWMRSEFREVMHLALSQSEGIDTKSLQFQALHMGDEGHNRNKAGTSMFLRALFPLLLKTGLPHERLQPVVDFINGNDGYFLSISMPSSKVCLDIAHGVEKSTMVTALARNGVDFGIRVSGLKGEWFTGPAQMVKGLYFPGYGDDDANPDMGDSAITETAGIGGFALSGAPAIVQLVGGSAADGIEISKKMYEITLFENMNFSQPVLDFRGSPTGIDIRKVVETGILPVITTGSVHKKAGEGQIGAGITHPPIDCFEKALLRFADVI